VESMGSSDRTCRARRDTALACSAVTGDWLIHRQFTRRQKLREKEPSPEPFVDQHRVFAMPANPRLRRMVTLQNRAGIHVIFLLSAEVAKKLVDLVELRLDHIVIIF